MCFCLIGISTCNRQIYFVVGQPLCSTSCFGFLIVLFSSFLNCPHLNRDIFRQIPYKKWNYFDFPQVVLTYVACTTILYRFIRYAFDINWKIMILRSTGLSRPCLHAEYVGLLSHTLPLVRPPRRTPLWTVKTDTEAMWKHGNCLFLVCQIVQDVLGNVKVERVLYC